MVGKMKTLTPSTVLVAVLVLFLGAGVLVPAQKLGEALWDGMSAACWTPYYGRAFLNTLMIGTAVAAAATLLGFIAAYALAVARIRGRAVVKALYLTPLFAPSVMPAIGLIYLVGSNGLILQTELYGPAGLFWGGLILHFRMPFCRSACRSRRSISVFLLRQNLWERVTGGVCGQSSSLMLPRG